MTLLVFKLFSVVCNISSTFIGISVSELSFFSLLASGQIREETDKSVGR